MEVSDLEKWINSDLSEYFNQIIGFNQKMGIARGTNIRFSAITSYLTIFGRLTQGQLKDLTKYSISNLSNSLNTLLGTGIVKKSRIAGTHTFEYYIGTSITNTILIIINILHRNLSGTVNFLSDIKNKLIDLSQLDLSGFGIISDQLDFIIGDLEYYDSIILKFISNIFSEQKVEKKYQPYPSKIPKFESYKDIELDEKLSSIEKVIIDYLQESLFAQQKGSSRSLVLSFFFTRGILTQNQLKKISGLSVGAISQGLKDLEAKKIVIVSPLKRNKKGKKLPRIYAIRSFSYAFINRICNIFDIIIEWKPKFQKFLSDLNKNVNIWENLKGYYEIKEFFENVLFITPKYEEFNDSVQILRNSC